MTRTYVGIDPGKRGYIAVRTGDDEWDFYPLLNASYGDMADYLRGVLARGNVFCCMEDVHAIYGSSAGATFEFGRINGALEGILCALCMPYERVAPRAWQGAVWSHADKIFLPASRSGGKAARRIDAKATSVCAARRLFPTVDLRRTERSRNVDDNKVDAMLLCEYARRRNL